MSETNESNLNEMQDALTVQPVADVNSPPGMLMRSGRKKRRLPPDKSLVSSSKKRRNRESKVHSSKREAIESSQGASDGSLQSTDENMENSEYSDEDSIMKEVDGVTMDKESGREVDSVTITQEIEPPSKVEANSIAFTVPEQENMPAKVPTIQNLHVPTEKFSRKLHNEPTPLDTPYDSRFLGRIVLDEVQDAHRSSIVETENVPVVEIQNLAEISNMRDPARQLFGNPQKEAMFIPDASQLELDEDEISEKSSFASRPVFWFIALLVFQGICFHYYFKPIISSLYGAVGPTVLFYKGLMKIEPEIIENIAVKETFIPIPSPPKKVKTVVEKIIYDDDASHVDDSKVTDLLEELSNTKNDILETISSAESMQKVLTNELDIVSDKLQNKANILESWDAALTQAEEVVNSIFNASIESLPIAIKNLEDSSVFNQLRKESLLPVDLDLVAAEVPMWEVASSSGCPQPPLNEHDPFITEKEVLEANADVKETAAVFIKEVVQNTSLVNDVESWVLDELEKHNLSVDIESVYQNNQAMDEFIGEDEEEDDGLVIGLTEGDAKKILSTRLETSLAEFVGLLDVAAKYNGAEIVRSGSRATTPSLAQSLPIVNRFMSAAKLRFYGHGPDVALTPTIPPDALGQCWSFQDVTMSKNARWKNVYQRDNTNGKYATLTVKLAKATTVKRVIIEHNSSPEKADSSAIMDFRVFGFQDNKAAGTPNFLGQYRYDKDGSSSQQFFITESHAELQSITLAIDTTYSKEYACLYRFRVLQD